MALFITSLNSGSNGNCYYIGSDTDAVLVDAGLSCRETERRMSRLGLSMSLVRAIFISHEHTDHIKGVPQLSKKYELPVYITPATLRGSNMSLSAHLVRGFAADNTVAIGGLVVKAFAKSHDAADPHSFLVSGGNVNVGVFTDIGFSCGQVTQYFGQCHAAFLEANYCEGMLAKGDYPYHLKRRISSATGHLSNTQALDLFTRYRSAHLSHLLLAHLSQNNNCPDLVARLFAGPAGRTQVVVASRHQETPVFRVGDTMMAAQKTKTRPSRVPIQQLSLFQ
ncbi:MAG: MBL fold metallo-hydrolase [Chitinophagaceae bacterium]